MVSIRSRPTIVSGSASIPISELHPAAEVAISAIAFGKSILNTRLAPIVKNPP